MATTQDKITALEARIIRLEEREEAAVGDERRDERKQLADMIIAARNNLHDLHTQLEREQQQQQQAQAGGGGQGQDSSLTELSAYACDLLPELCTVKFHQGMLKLGDRFYFPVEKGVGGNIMFQKPCNDDFVLISEYRREFTRGPMRRTGLIVIGRPGSGKSWAAMHFLWYYVNKGATVVYDCVENDTAWVFRNDGRCRVIRSPRNTIDIPELDDTDTVHIHDAKAGDNSREPIRGICHVILMTSANLSSHKQFERSVPAKYAYPETPLEIFELIGKEFGIYSDWIAECADKYGCNIRLLVMGREGAQDVVNSALGRWSPKIMMDIMDDNNLTPSHTSNPAVLITPRVDDSTSENEDPLALQRRYKFLTASWDFASAHVRLQVQDKHAEQLLDIARSVCQDKDKGAKAEWAIPAILAAGGEFTVRKFVDKDFTTDTITLDAAKLIYGSSVSGSDTAKIDDVLSSCKDPNAWYCFNGTFPLFDLFRPPYMFVNSTVNANHKTHYGLAAHLVEKCPGAEMFYATPRVVFDKINQMPTFGEVRVNNAKDVMQNSYVFWNLPDEQKLKLKNWKVHTLCVTQKRQFSTSARVSSVLRFPIMSAFAVPASTLPALSGAVLRGCMRLLKKL